MNRQQASVVITMVAESWPGDMTELTQLAWAQELADLDYDEVCVALLKLAKHLEFRPTVARVVREVRVPGLEEARPAVMRLLGTRGSSATTEEIAALGTAARRLVLAAGGWQAICRLREVDVPHALDRAVLAVGRSAGDTPALHPARRAALTEGTTE